MHSTHRSCLRRPGDALRSADVGGKTVAGLFSFTASLYDGPFHPRHQHRPQSGTCHPCLRYEMSPMSRVGQSGPAPIGWANCPAISSSPMTGSAEPCLTQGGNACGITLVEPLGARRFEPGSASPSGMRETPRKILVPPSARATCAHSGSPFRSKPLFRRIM